MHKGMLLRISVRLNNSFNKNRFKQSNTLLSLAWYDIRHNFWGKKTYYYVSESRFKTLKKFLKQF